MGSTIEIRLEIAAEPATVYRFLADPERFQQWMGPGALLEAASITIRYPNGHVARGAIREREENRRLVFGYGYEDGLNGLPTDSSTVTIELQPSASGTLLVLRHEGLDEAQGRNHRMGWRYYVGQLAAVGGDAGAGAVLGTALQHYLEAWNGDDPLCSLAACWAPDGVYRDRMTSATGRADFAASIAMARQSLPGVRLELEGTPAHVLGYVRFGWRIRQGDGPAIGSGQCFGRLLPSGHFTELTGFWNPQ